MARAVTTPLTGIRVRMTPRELEAARAYGASRRRLSVAAIVGFSVVAIGCASLVLGSLAHLLVADRPGGGWIVLLVGSDLLVLSLVFLWLIRRQARRIEADLALGSKLVVDGVVNRRGCNCKSGNCIYSIRVYVPPHKQPGTFNVSERVFKNLAVGDAVRCAYLPTARTLLSLSSAKVAYAIGEPD